MSEERLRILKMLDKGIISVEEANELLVTIQASNYQYVEAKNRVNKISNTSAPLEIETSKKFVNFIKNNGSKLWLLDFVVLLLGAIFLWMEFYLY